jgi:hypothetical protein
MTKKSVAARFFRAETRKFTETEDVKLRKLVAEWGTDDWALVARHMGGGRTTRQCRERWQNYLRPGIVNGPWTKEEEDLLVLKYSEIGPLWQTIQQFFPTRTDIDIKNRWQKRQRRLRLTTPQAFLTPSFTPSDLDEWDNWDWEAYP